MIDLYTWSTPNGNKIHIMLEETGLDYRLHPVNLDKAEQKTADFLAINPNGKIPAIIDRAGPDGKPLAIFESGAILVYLAEKSGALIPSETAGKWRTMSWLMFQVGAVGPFLGQAGYFLHRASEPVPFAVERFVTEAERLYGVVESRLSESAYLAGEYSIADIACYPWMKNHQRFSIDIEEYPAIARWLDAIAARPAVTRAMSIQMD